VADAQQLGEHAAAVAADGAEPRVAQLPGHQVSQLLSDVGKQLWPRCPGPAGVAADEPWHHHVEADAGVAAMPGRVGEKGDELEVAADRVWPAVEQQQRRRVGAGAASMDEGKGLAGELGRVVRERVEVGLLPVPVVAVLPVLASSFM
jgi:hypothetical protein